MQIQSVLISLSLSFLSLVRFLPHLSEEKRNEINAKWQSEKSVVDAIQTLKKEIEEYKLEAEKAENATTPDNTVRRLVPASERPMMFLGYR